MENTEITRQKDILEIFNDLLNLKDSTGHGYIEKSHLGSWKINPSNNLVLEKTNDQKNWLHGKSMGYVYVATNCSNEQSEIIYILVKQKVELIDI